VVLTLLLVKLLPECDLDRNLCRRYFSVIIYTILENFKKSVSAIFQCDNLYNLGKFKKFTVETVNS